jgi:hypothetical protein
MTTRTDLRFPSYEDVQLAAKRIAGVAHRTPVLTSRTADAATGAKLYFKAENLQRAGAFKFRGAYNSIAALDPEARKRGVIAFSSGNHAQAIAYAASLQGAPSTIVMPSDAPAIKVAATRAYGANVVFYDRYKEDRGDRPAPLGGDGRRSCAALRPSRRHRRTRHGGNGTDRRSRATRHDRNAPWRRRVACRNDARRKGAVAGLRRHRCRAGGRQ